MSKTTEDKLDDAKASLILFDTKKNLVKSLGALSAPVYTVTIVDGQKMYTIDPSKNSDLLDLMRKLVSKYIGTLSQELSAQAKDLRGALGDISDDIDPASDPSMK